MNHLPNLSTAVLRLLWPFIEYSGRTIAHGRSAVLECVALEAKAESLVDMLAKACFIRDGKLLIMPFPHERGLVLKLEMQVSDSPTPGFQYARMFLLCDVEMKTVSIIDDGFTELA